MKVWLGSLQLARKIPTPHALRQLLYGSESASADNADVIALLLTDLEVTEDDAERLHRLLSKSLRNPADYIFNEDDKALVIRYLPVQQARPTEHGQRYVLLAVAVHRRNVVDPDNKGERNLHDCFPVPVYLACKSPRKNEVAAFGKAVIVQDVVLQLNGSALDLVPADARACAPAAASRAGGTASKPIATAPHFCPTEIFSLEALCSPWRNISIAHA